MEIIKTNDNSTTLYSDIYGEAYHSRNGALKEAFNKYCSPCRIEELALKGTMVILDVGFGLGYNVLAALFCAKRINSDCHIKIISLEKYLIQSELLMQIEMPLEYRNLYRIVLSAAKEKGYCSDDINIEILCGDARDEIKNIDELFDAVFLDPFSVRKNPQLWTVNFFKELFIRMKETAILSTYSASTPVRTGLIEAGFYVGEGPGDEMKQGGTVASKSDGLVFLNTKNFNKMRNSPERIPYYDPQLNFTDREIFNYRDKLKEQ